MTLVPDHTTEALQPVPEVARTTVVLGAGHKADTQQPVPGVARTTVVLADYMADTLQPVPGAAHKADTPQPVPEVDRRAADTRVPQGLDWEDFDQEAQQGHTQCSFCWGSMPSLNNSSGTPQTNKMRLHIYALCLLRKIRLFSHKISSSSFFGGGGWSLGTFCWGALDISSRSPALRFVRLVAVYVMSLGASLSSSSGSAA
jgi:hypothetical protein